MNSQAASGIAVACFLQIGCATTNDAASQAEAARPRGEAVYQTGSAIPRRTTETAPAAAVSTFSTQDYEDEFGKKIYPNIVPGAGWQKPPGGK